MFKRKPVKHICYLCGDKFESTACNVKYCSDLCRKIAKKRAYKRFMEKHGKVSRVGDIDTCKRCGDDYLVRNGNQIYCTPCRNYMRSYPGGDNPVIGTEMTCGVCGETIRRNSATQKYCTHKCTPAEGLLIECRCCGKEKPYDDFYDYRGIHPDGRMGSTCKECILEKIKGRNEKKVC